jgi:2-polyprenyl-6-methoxyphenol hydroxylase-like FAD-dependent oxidoreductase
MRQLRVAVVGGSIAGCSAAILLSRAGHDVHVYERSPGGLVGRGGGIGTPVPVLQGLMDEDVVDRDMPYLVADAMPFIVRTDAAPETGVVPWEMPMQLAAFHWSALWGQLRRRVPDDRYHRSATVADVAEDDRGRLTVRFEQGDVVTADLAVFADGYQSLGRRLLFPDVGLRYRGYQLWRGLLPERRLADPEVLGSNCPRISYATMPGNFVCYLVPGQDGSIRPGERLVNWAAYIPVADDALPTFMVDRSGRAREGAIPPGEVRPEVEESLKSAMEAELPGYYGAMVRATEHTYVQLIYTAQMPAYHRGAACLIGDAGAVAQPFTGSGVFKGYNNTQSLLEVLDRHDDPVAALEEWDADQVRLADRLLALGDQMEQAFIWDSLDLTTADAESTEAWWRSAVQFPDDFTYEARS